MKYVKVTNGEANQYPYTIGKLRRDNPNVSFPKVISEELLTSLINLSLRQIGGL